MSRMPTWGAMLVAACSLVLQVGCGYALAGRGSFLPANITTVGIPEFENATSSSTIEQVLTEKIRAEFIGRGKYTILPQAAGADAVLSGQILSIGIQPVGVTEQQLASRYLVTLSMKVAFTDTRTTEVLWSNDSLTFREEYELATRNAVGLEADTFLDQERSSLERIAVDVARSVVTAIVEAF